jgi:hypothetical protein
MSDQEPDVFPPNLPPLPIVAPTQVKPPAVHALSIGGFVIEGVDGDDHLAHARLFYKQLLPMMQSSGPSWKLGTCQRYDCIMDAMVRICKGETTSQVRATYPQAYKWRKAYALVNNEVGGFILVDPPDNTFGLDGDDIDADIKSVVKLTYFEAAYLNINKCHLPNHTKGRTLYALVCQSYSNIGQNITKLYTETCPICIGREVGNKPPVGVRPILTIGFGTRGQVDIIDFQSLPNGEFKYLLNYIDHGIKFLFSIPLKFKRALCIAYALLEIFTMIGPPMILQSNNGKEFLQAAMTRRQNNEYTGKLIALTKEDLTKIIAKVRELWPECRMVQGLPRHSPSNGGVERVNRTVEEKFGAWMRETKNTQWSVGCRLIMRRYNTQVHRTIKNIPYKCMFGQVPCVGISSLPLDEGLISMLSTGAQLNRVSDYKGKVKVLDDNGGDDIVRPDLEDDDDVVGIDVTDNFSVVDEMEVVDNQALTQDNQGAVAVAEVIGGDAKASAEAADEAADVIVVNDKIGGDENQTSSEESDTPVAEVVIGTTGIDDKDSLTAWFSAVDELAENVFINLESLSSLTLCESVPIAWCVDTHDVSEMRSFVPAFLTRVTKNMWAVTDAMTWCFRIWI